MSVIGVLRTSTPLPDHFIHDEGVPVKSNDPVYELFKKWLTISVPYFCDDEAEFSFLVPTFGLHNITGISGDGSAEVTGCVNVLAGEEVPRDKTLMEVDEDGYLGGDEADVGAALTNNG